jgi:hypothetical protein
LLEDKTNALARVCCGKLRSVTAPECDGKSYGIKSKILVNQKIRGVTITLLLL